MLQKFLPLLVIIALLSGCTTMQGSPGLAIVDFEPDFTSVYSGEKVSFSVRVRNQGSVDSGPGDVWILGLEEWTSVSGSCNFPTLIASGPVTQGEIKACPPFTFQAPQVPLDIPVTYSPTARLIYYYSTDIVKSITVGSSEELARIEKGGGSLPLETQSSTTGPITITAQSKSPIRVFDSSFMFPLELTVANTGGGVVCFPDCIEDTGRNRLMITAFIGEDPITDCTRELSLPRTQSNKIACEVRVERPDIGLIQKTIRVHSDYHYFTDLTTSVKVEWAPT